MKKLSKIALLALCGILFSGCAGNNPLFPQKPDFSAGYSMTAEINCGKLEAVADVVYNAENDWQFTFSEPKALAGMTLNFTEKGLSGALGELDFDVDENENYTLLPEIIASSIETLASVPAEKRAISDGIMTIETAFNGKPVTVTADPSGKLISLKCPYYSVAVNFSNRSKITQNSSESSDTSESNAAAISPVYGEK